MASLNNRYTCNAPSYYERVFLFSTWKQVLRCTRYESAEKFSRYLLQAPSLGALLSVQYLIEGGA